MTGGGDSAGRGAQVSVDWYENRLYNSKERFCSYWHQIDEILELEATSVLEIGPGGGLVTSELKRRGIEVITLDVAEDTGPDLVGSITSIPLADGAVDVALAAQVLEHLPFDEVAGALSELARVSRKGAVVSVPDQTPFVGGSYPLYFGLYIESMRAELSGSRMSVIGMFLRRKVRFRDLAWIRLVPAWWGLGGRTWRVPIPVPHQPVEFEFDGQHYWELGTERVGVEEFRLLVQSSALAEIIDFRVPENPWHHFFVMKMPR